VWKHCSCTGVYRSVQQYFNYVMNMFCMWMKRKYTINTTQPNDKWQRCKTFYRSISKADDNILHIEYRVSPPSHIISSNLCKLVPTFFSQCHIRFQMCNFLGLKLCWWNVRHLFSHNPDFLNSIIYCLYIFTQMFSRCDGGDTLYSMWSILSC
jgi:hypothetical protein